jgi:hypothetical protein
MAGDETFGLEVALPLAPVGKLSWLGVDRGAEGPLTSRMPGVESSTSVNRPAPHPTSRDVHSAVRHSERRANQNSPKQQARAVRATLRGLRCSSRACVSRYTSPLQFRMHPRKLFRGRNHARDSLPDVLPYDGPSRNS